MAQSETKTLTGTINYTATTDEEITKDDFTVTVDNGFSNWDESLAYVSKIAVDVSVTDTPSGDDNNEGGGTPRLRLSESLNGVSQSFNIFTERITNFSNTNNTNVNMTLEGFTSQSVDYYREGNTSYHITVNTNGSDFSATWNETSSGELGTFTMKVVFRTP